MEITESCLDAETLAAWVDGGLTAPELERAQSHVAGCVRCQTMVGTLARISTAAPAVKAERAPRRWLGFLVPLAAAAAAVTIWVAIPGSNLDTREPVAMPPASPVYTPEAKAPAVPPSAQTAEAVSAPAAARARDAKEVRSEAAVPTAALDKIGSAGAAASAPPMAPPPAETAAASTMKAQADAPITNANALESGRLAARRDFSAAQAGGPAEIVSPDPMVRWRIASSAGPNVVERSTNGGQSWESTPTGVTTALTAGSAVSPTVCWIVGRAGTVILTTDGRTWQRVPPPEMTDLSSVRARDPRAASVTTADGRVFSTTSAGATWTPGPLQGF